jgi:formamidopyrimidine-DNA glycosylase
MPELPEVETTRRGLAPLANGKTIESIVVRQPQLRWPIPRSITQLHNTTIHALNRRAKWLIWDLDEGHLLWHLGMSGSFRAWTHAPAPGPHDHVDVQLRDGHLIRYTDPRRFGALLWTRADPRSHPRLATLGPEPFDGAFNADYLYRLSRGRRSSVKSFIMDGRVVVGVGNIYACESLFSAGIHPGRPAGRISQPRYQQLTEHIVRILSDAIEVGGTSLRDFTVGDGTPGYFGQELKVYGRENQPCLNCSSSIKRIIIGQRSSFYCPRCQR